MLPVGINLSQMISYLKQQQQNDGLDKNNNNTNNDNNKGEQEKIQDLNITMNDLQSLRLRGKDVSKLESFLASSSFGNSWINQQQQEQNQNQQHQNQFSLSALSSPRLSMMNNHYSSKSNTNFHDVNTTTDGVVNVGC